MYDKNISSLFLLIDCLVVIILSETPENRNHWNVSQWWDENYDFNHKEDDLEFVNNRDQSLEFRFSPGGDSRPDYTLYIPTENENMNSSDLIESLESYDETNSVIPRSSTQSILDTFYNYFTNVRSYRGDRNYYFKIKRSLKEKFLKLGLDTASQSFWPPEVNQYRYGDKAHNIIGIWPGTNRGTSRDKIIIIGAHYDTVKSSPGVDDNGSGSTAVIEIAKLIAQNNCKLENTLMFVLFDMEENGLKGSKHFVKDYLIPVEINKNGAKVLGAIIMDMILEHDTSLMSQSLGTLAGVLPEWAQSVKYNGYRGDFAAIWARKGIDTKLYEKLKKNWLNKSIYKLSLMDPLMPKFGYQIETGKYSRFKKYETFMRSDHASFWYPTRKNLTINAILITDLGPWRRNMKSNYHRSSDDTRIINENNLSFIKNTIDSITNTLLDVSNGKCFK